MSRSELSPSSVRILCDKARPGVGPVGTNDDARTLWTDWDGQGERHKPWRSVCQESRQLDHAGLGLGGEGAERDSRTGHELSVLTNAFYQGGTYDQLDVGGLGPLDVICRRIAVLGSGSLPGRSAHERRGHPARVAILRHAACQRGCGHPERSAEVLHSLFCCKRGRLGSSELSRVRTRKGVVGVFSRRQMDESSGRGMGDGSPLAAVHRAWRSPEEQPRLPYSACSRGLFPLGRDTLRDLPSKGYTRRVGLVSL